MNLFKIKKLLTLFSALALFSCSKDPYAFLSPQLPYEQPFKFDKAGEKTAVDFWVLPKQQKIDGSESYGVYFSFEHSLNNDPSELVKAVEIPMQAELHLVQGQNLKPVPFSAYAKPRNKDASIDTRDTYPDGKGIVFASEHGRGADSTRYAVLWFKPSEYGQYRVVLQPTKDNPSISAVGFKLRVTNIDFGK